MCQVKNNIRHQVLIMYFCLMQMEYLSDEYSHKLIHLCRNRHGVDFKKAKSQNPVQSAYVINYALLSKSCHLNIRNEIELLIQFLNPKLNFEASCISLQSRSLIYCQFIKENSCSLRFGLVYALAINYRQSVSYSSFQRLHTFLRLVTAQK